MSSSPIGTFSPPLTANQGKCNAITFNLTHLKFYCMKPVPVFRRFKSSSSEPCASKTDPNPTSPSRRGSGESSLTGIKSSAPLRTTWLSWNLRLRSNSVRTSSSFVCRPRPTVTLTNGRPSSPDGVNLNKVRHHVTPSMT